MADSFRINEHTLRSLGVDLATIQALRNIENKTNGGSSTQGLLEAILMSMVPAKAEENKEASLQIPPQKPEPEKETLFLVALSQASKINELQSQIDQLRTRLDSVENLSPLRERVTNVEAQAWQILP